MNLRKPQDTSVFNTAVVKLNRLHFYCASIHPFITHSHTAGGVSHAGRRPAGQ